MHPPRERGAALFLAGEGFNQSHIARWMGLPRSTVRQWIRPYYVPLGRLSRVALELERIPKPEYAYLLGLYLGDGTISRHHRGVYALRIFMDERYENIIEGGRSAMQAVLPESRATIGSLPSRAVQIYSYSKAWPLFFPQHGSGMKHTRKIELALWQQEIVDDHPHEFLRGLIHSDGCRVLNRVNGKDYPRFFFSQVSDDIRRIFCDTCNRLGIRWRQNRWNSISIARAPSVALMDSFVGPKS
jgi:hypothetical protein